MSTAAATHSIETASGRFVDLADPDPRDITLDDIAHGLANTCRYGGQCARFFSVAEHACLVADRMLAAGADAAQVLWGLHHDSHETYLVDLPTPLKRMLPGYELIAARLDLAICVGLGLPPAPGAIAEVKAADQWAMAVEAWHLMPSRGEGWTASGDLADVYRDWLYASSMGWTPEHAKRAFLARHEQFAGRAAGDAIARALPPVTDLRHHNQPEGKPHGST